MSGPLFDDRYGAGAYAALLDLLQQPCVTFAGIAERFGVTRECVRQWHQRLLPGAPTGHERQRLCRQRHSKRRLLEDRLFATFYRHIRAHLGSRPLTLVPSRDGFRKRTVGVLGQVILIKRARHLAPRSSPHSSTRSWTRRHADDTAVYTLTTSAARADFVYYELTETDYLFIPRAALPARATTFVDGGSSKYRRFKNTFAPCLPTSLAGGERKDAETRAS